jgi:hypothetical protein
MPGLRPIEGAKAPYSIACVRAGIGHTCHNLRINSVNPTDADGMGRFT